MEKEWWNGLKIEENRFSVGITCKTNISGNLQVINQTTGGGCT